MSKRWAFIVACNDYAISPLTNCHRDADLLAETLTEWCDYGVDHVVLSKLSFKNPSSPGDLISSLENLVAKTDQGDTILFFFAGHGCGWKDDGWLLLPETTMGELETTGLSIKRVSEALRAPGRICVRIFDACHSGIDVRDQQDEESLARAITSSQPDGLNWVTLASCRENEYSYEDQERGQGAFTACLVDAIREMKENEPVLPGSLYECTYRKLQEVNTKHGRIQNPVINNSLSGLWGIATRVKRVLPQQEESDSLSRSSVLEKLEKERSNIQNLVKHRFKEIDTIIDLAQDILKAESNKLCQWSVSPKVATGKTSLIPDNMKPVVVTTLTKLNVRSLHTFIESRKSSQPSKPFFGLFDGLSNPFDLQPKTYEINDGTPDATRTVATLRWDGDEFVPSGCILVFVVPLETKLYVLVWYRVNSFVDSKRAITSTLARFGQVNEDWKDIFSAPISEAVAGCNSKIQESVTARISYLERERGRQ